MRAGSLSLAQHPKQLGVNESNKLSSPTITSLQPSLSLNYWKFLFSHSVSHIAQSPRMPFPFHLQLMQTYISSQEVQLTELAAPVASELSPP